MSTKDEKWNEQLLETKKKQVLEMENSKKLIEFKNKHKKEGLIQGSNQNVSELIYLAAKHNSDINDATNEITESKILMEKSILDLETSLSINPEVSETWKEHLKGITESTKEDKIYNMCVNWWDIEFKNRILKKNGVNFDILQEKEESIYISTESLDMSSKKEENINIPIKSLDMSSKKEESIDILQENIDMSSKKEEYFDIPSKNIDIPFEKEESINIPPVLEENEQILCDINSHICINKSLLYNTEVCNVKICTTEEYNTEVNNVKICNMEEIELELQSVIEKLNKLIKDKLQKFLNPYKK